ncbi:nucleotide pyrophosphohydrolase [Candidatus Dojkabacteria bacterium]|nr:nucleotide pyrophosphohydrolase [Candidatus Dojkabacteria bacterium]
MKREIIEKLIKFRDDRDWKQFHSEENLAKSISIEAGELLECFQWTSKYDKKEVIEELADILIYIALLAETLDVNIDEIVQKKIEQNSKKYPVEKAKGTSKKYTKL